MISYEQNSDIVRWGLQLFDGYPPSSHNYGESMIPNDATYCDGEYFSNGGYVIESIHAKHGLQAQLSQLEIREMSDSHMENEQTQSQSYSYDWIGHLASYSPCKPCDIEDLEVTDEIRPSTSCCPCQEPSSDVWICTLNVVDEYSLDYEVGKRLNQMDSVSHVPRINGEIPSVDEATSDHQRLLDRLQRYHLVELKVQGDGNCQFRALSDQFYRTIEHHKFVRQQVVDQLKSNREIYEGYVPMEYDDYLEKMSKNGEWGDHVTLQAAADSYGVKVFVVTSFKETSYIEILPAVPKSNRVICLSFWAEVHYNSIYPEEATPVSYQSEEKEEAF